MSSKFKSRIKDQMKNYKPQIHHCVITDEQRAKPKQYIRPKNPKLVPEKFAPKKGK